MLGEGCFEHGVRRRIQSKGEVLGQAVRSTRKKSRRVIKEYGEGEASTSSIDLDEVVEEGYSDDDDYDDDDEDMFDEPFESKSE